MCCHGDILIGKGSRKNYKKLTKTFSMWQQESLDEIKRKKEVVFTDSEPSEDEDYSDETFPTYSKYANKNEEEEGKNAMELVTISDVKEK